MSVQFTIDNLQSILKNKYLPISGTKEELIRRLRISLKNKIDGKKEKKFKKKFTISNHMLKNMKDKKNKLTVEEILEINRERGLSLPRNKTELLKILKNYLKKN